MTAAGGTTALRSRSTAYALLARMLGSDVEPLIDSQVHHALAAALRSAGLAVLADEVVSTPTPCLPREDLAGLWVRWFDLGRVAPYEGSHVLGTSGGITPRLADIAGFYRAFNLRTSRERPDHVVAELEFLAVALLVHAERIEAGDAEGEAVVHDAIRTFVRDHAGRWMTAWAARVGAIDELQPWAMVARTAATLVAAEAAARKVVPLRDGLALVADAGLADDEEALLECGDEEDLSLVNRSQW